MKHHFFLIAFSSILFFALHTAAQAEILIPSPSITPRAQWGADESFTYINGGEANDAGEDIETGAAKSKFEENDPLIREVKFDDETGKPLIWPLQYAKDIKFITVHHTASTRNLNDPTLELRNIYHHHAVNLEWGDIGYHFLIDPNGKVYEGRKGGKGVVGGHSLPLNKVAIGVSVMGDYESGDISGAALKSLLSILQYLVDEYDLKPDGTAEFKGITYAVIHGHKDNDVTTCPGRFLHSKLPAIRRILAYNKRDNGKQLAADWSYADTFPRPIITLSPDEVEEIKIRIKNNGGLTWTSGGIGPANAALPSGVEFLAEDAQGNSQLAIMENSSVGPGQMAFFEGRIGSKNIPGLYIIETVPRLKAGNSSSSFAKLMPIPVIVEAPVLRYDVIEVVEPSESVMSGDVFTGSITLRNTGNVTWKVAGKNTITASELTLELARDTAPGELGNFTVSGSAEKSSYRLALSMDGLGAGESAAAFTSDPIPFSLRIQGVSDDALLGLPGKLKAREEVVADIPFKNETKKTIGRAGVTSFVIKSAGVSVAIRGLVETSVAPGDTGHLQIKVTAPAKRGTYYIQLRPLYKGVKILSAPLQLQFQVMSDAKSSFANAGDMRVKITFNESSAKVAVNTKMQAFANTKFIQGFTRFHTVEVKPVGQKELSVTWGETTYKTTEPVRIQALFGGSLKLANFTNRPSFNKNPSDSEYLDTLEFRNIDGALAVINELPLEDYLRGIAEPANDDPVDKQKALAVLARSYALWYMTSAEKFPGKPWHLDDDPAVSQRYLGYGYQKRTGAFVAAVDGTAGQVVTYQGKLIKTPYFSQSDGRTRSGLEVFGWEDTPYLQSVPDTFCGEGTELRGHGVGLSGCGARELAKQGKSFIEIIKYYYAGVEVQRVRDL